MSTRSLEGEGEATPSVEAISHNDETNPVASSSTPTSSANRRSATLPTPSQAQASSASSASPTPRPIRPARFRSRTSTYSQYTSDLAPVMSRENSAEDPSVQQADMADDTSMMNHLSKSFEAGPSYSQPLYPDSSHSHRPPTGRRASKSISGMRPSVVVTPVKRNNSYYTPQVTSPAFLTSPTSPEVDMHNEVKRRTSIPSLIRRNTIREDGEGQAADEQSAEYLTNSSNGKGRAVESRARSTSTSVVMPNNRDLTEMPVYSLDPVPTSTPPGGSYRSQPSISSPQQMWPGVTITPATPSDILVTPSDSDAPPSFLTSAYNIGESSLLRLAMWARPQRHQYHVTRRGSDEDSEKGLNGSEDETVESDARQSDESSRRGGRYWGFRDVGDSLEDEVAPEYFSRPTTSSDDGFHSAGFEASSPYDDEWPASLPTPALSTQSLSRQSSKRSKLRRTTRRRTQVGTTSTQGGWLKALVGVWAGSGGGKTSEVLRELGWTVGGLVGTFFVTALVVLWLIQGLPITTLKHMPKSTTDLQLLSAEIRSYMSSSDVGWWHTVGVIVFVGCWKHAWSVPGAVVLNILVGSLLDPMPALGLLTIITASGSLGAYLLSRPLAPLIAVLFPKPLALVRAALAPDSVPAPSTATIIEGETVTPIQTSSDPAAQPIGGPDEKPNVWRRLLIMRAMGFVPWSGMNVACGVVGVDWRVFWLTTAAGSASWSYVTASVGQILSRLKVPTAALAASAAGEASEEVLHGESLTSLLRDPVLIGKLVFLSALTLLPVIVKRRSNHGSASTSTTSTPRSSSSIDPTGFSSAEPKPLIPEISALRLDLHTTSPLSPPMSPLSQSLATFTPTPRALDLLSFGRAAIRQSGRAVVGGVRGTVGGVGRLVGSVGR